MQQTHLDKHHNSEDSDTVHGQQACDSKATCRFLSFLLPAVIVVGMNTSINWLETSALSVQSLAAAFLSSLAPGVLAGLSGLLLYTTIKSAKR